METIRIECEPNIRAKILEFISSFSDKECKVVNEDSSFEENKKKLDATLEKIDNGTAKFYSIEEVDAYLDDVISKYEN